MLLTTYIERLIREREREVPVAVHSTHGCGESGALSSLWFLC
jgi:hypothetical protein